MATPPPRRPSLPATPQSFRRSFTAPVARLSPSPRPNHVDSSDDAADILFSHPSTKTFFFSPPDPGDEKSTKAASQDFDYPVDAIETLPWSAPRETMSAKGSLIIEKVKGSVPFLKTGTVVHAMMRNSQCWCVDGDSKFVLRVGRFRYYRIEFPNATEEDSRKIEELKEALRKIIRFEVTPCPFRRDFKVDLPSEVITPKKKRAWKPRQSVSGNSPLSTTSPRWLDERPSSRASNSWTNVADDESPDDDGSSRSISRTRSDAVEGITDRPELNEELQDDSEPEESSDTTSSSEASEDLEQDVTEEITSPTDSSSTSPESKSHIDEQSHARHEGKPLAEDAPLSPTRGVAETTASGNESSDDAENVDAEMEKIAESRNVESPQGKEENESDTENATQSAPEGTHFRQSEDGEGRISLPTVVENSYVEDDASGDLSEEDDSPLREEEVDADQDSSDEDSSESSSDVADGSDVGTTAMEPSFDNTTNPEQAEIQPSSDAAVPIPTSPETISSQDSSQPKLSSSGDSFHSLVSYHSSTSSLPPSPPWSRSSSPVRLPGAFVFDIDHGHKRELSQVTLRGEAEKPPQHQPATPSLRHESASEDDWPKVSTPAPVVEGARQRRIGKRSGFSPLPPASTLLAPSSRSGDHHLATAIVQRAASFALGKPIDAVILIMHVLGRIAAGATVNDLMSGELFRGADSSQRRQSEDDREQDEDDFGHPTRGRGRSAGARTPITTEWELD